MLDLFLKDSIYYYIFYLSTCLWLFEFILLRPKSKGQKNHEKRSFFLVLSGILSIVILNILSGFFSIMRPFNDSINTLLMQISITLYVSGLILRYVSILYLGKYFTRNVAIEQKHELISKGPYRLLRHPLYVGLFLLSTSVPLFFGHIYVYIFAFVLMSYMLNHRMRLEETLLLEHFGPSYETWKSKRYRFIPFIY